MRVIAVKTLREFWAQYPAAETGLKHWYERVGKVSYDSPAGVLSDFKGADFVGNTRIVFNIAKNKFRLICRTAHAKQGAGGRSSRRLFLGHAERHAQTSVHGV